MAIIDKAITIKGSDAKVSCVQIYPQPDGKIVLVVSGATLDSEGAQRGLKEAQIVYVHGAGDAVSEILRHSLDALRKVNGLEDGAVTLEPKVEAPLNATKLAEGALKR